MPEFQEIASNVTELQARPANRKEKLALIEEQNAKMAQLRRIQPKMHDYLVQRDRVQAGLDRAVAHVAKLADEIAHAGSEKANVLPEAPANALEEDLRRTFSAEDAGAIVGALISGTELEFVGAMALQTKFEALHVGQASLEELIDRVDHLITDLAEEAGGRDVGGLLQETYLQRDALLREVRYGFSN